MRRNFDEINYDYYSLEMNEKMSFEIINSI